MFFTIHHSNFTVEFVADKNFEIGALRRDLTINAIYFNFGQYELRPEADSTLRNILNKVDDLTEYIVVITAHTDSIGSYENNNYMKALLIGVLFTKTIYSRMKQEISTKPKPESSYIHISQDGVKTKLHKQMNKKSLTKHQLSQESEMLAYSSKKGKDGCQHIL